MNRMSIRYSVLTIFRGLRKMHLMTLVLIAIVIPHRAQSWPGLPWFKASEDQLIDKYETKKKKGDDQLYGYAHRKLKQDSKNPIALYFLADYHLQKAISDTSYPSSYKNVSRCLSYARKFERYSAAKLQNKLNWKFMRHKMDTAFSFEYERLLAIELQEKAHFLANKYERLKGVHPIVTEHKTDDNDQTKVTDRFDVFGYLKGPFYGMPSGQEQVEGRFGEMEWKLLELINKERLAQGMSPLQMQKDLVRAARYHAVDMATQHYFNHNSFDRKNGELVEVGETFPRIRAFYNQTFVNSENIAAGSSDAEGTYYQWYTSKGHNQNMFNKSSKLVGIGVAYTPDSPFKYYWVFCTAM